MRMELNFSSKLGSGCGSAGRVVASDVGVPWFESSQRQIFYLL